MWKFLAFLLGLILILAIIEELIHFFAKRYVTDDNYSPKKELLRLKETFIKLWKKANIRKKASSKAS